uniref:C-type lectin domain-containing protein n=1 Tax=Anabas testudineus TaxID=64144 RepID=A0AAQ6IDK2_ANATE
SYSSKQTAQCCFRLFVMFLFIVSCYDKFSTIKTNLTELLQGSQIKLSSLTEERNKLKTNLTEITEERDQLKTNLNEITEEHNRLQCLCKQSESVRDKAHGVSMMTATNNCKHNDQVKMIKSSHTTCPDGWKKLCLSCYFLSTKSGSWTTGREDCRTRGADLVVIHSAEEQVKCVFMFDTWIGLNDRDKEGTWKWVDGTPLTVTYWASKEPNNGNADGNVAEEDCVKVLGSQSSNWNDNLCEAS